MSSYPVNSTINLHQTITRLVGLYQAVAGKQNCYFRSYLQPNLYVNTDADTLNTLLGSLLYMTARCSRDTSIIISGAVFSDRGAISILMSSPADACRILHGFQHLDMLSQKINGFLEVTNYKNQETTISFYFRNNAVSKILPAKELRRA